MDNRRTSDDKCLQWISATAAQVLLYHASCSAPPSHGARPRRSPDRRVRVPLINLWRAATQSPNKARKAPASHHDQSVAAISGILACTRSMHAACTQALCLHSACKCVTRHILAHPSHILCARRDNHSALRPLGRKFRKTHAPRRRGCRLRRGLAFIAASRDPVLQVRQWVGEVGEREKKRVDGASGAGDFEVGREGERERRGDGRCRMGVLHRWLT